MTTPSPINPPRNKQRQRGAALIVLGLILVLGLITLFTFRMERKGPELEADRKTALALSQAKEALLGYAATDSNHPGTLPCPDADNDGESKTSQDYDGSACAAPVGRLPWKFLGLPDLRDGHGERLWYAVSPFFDANTSGNINTSKLGEITVKTSADTVTNNSNPPATSGAIAVIFSPGPVILRSGVPQNRTCIVGTNCTLDEVCTNKPYTDAPKCTPSNYLDKNDAEDNANFTKNSSNGFIGGIIKDTNGLIEVNDRIGVITHADIFTAVTRRVTREFAQSLNYPYPISINDADAIMPSESPWKENNWVEAVVTYTATKTGGSADYNQITLQYINCETLFTITWSGTASTVLQNGRC